MMRHAFRACSTTLALLSAFLAVGLPKPAMAQNPDLNLRQERQQAQLPVATPPPPIQDEGHLLGDWGGFRSLLKSYGVTLDVDYFFEVGSNVSGGKKQGTGYTDQRDTSQHRPFTG